MILGAVLAGGRSARFGSDKALAMLGGQSLLARAVVLLQGQCDAVVVVGRDAAPAPCIPAPCIPALCIPDWPAPGRGPLAGLAAALRHAAAHGFGEVLCLPVDALGLDTGLLAALTPAPAYIASQPVIGLWPLAALPALETILAGSGRHSLRALAEAVQARAVTLMRPPANINSPDDLLAADLTAMMEPPHGL